MYKDIREAVLGKNCGAKESQEVFSRLCCDSGELGVRVNHACDDLICMLHVFFGVVQSSVLR